MPTLNWIGKEAVVDHHLRVPTRLLECDRELSVGDADAENLVVEGDNLEALKALLPRYRGQVKCIYIDPPYNTGNENWVYNDNVNDPRIRKWLGEVVGKEAEDLCRHDKWLCMMYPRLRLLRDLLRDDGVIIVHIDEHALAQCIFLLNEVFAARNCIGQLIWDKGNPKGDSSGVGYQHECLLIYAVNKPKLDAEHGPPMIPKPNAERMLRKAESLVRSIGKNKIPDDFSAFARQFKLPEVFCAGYRIKYELVHAQAEFERWVKGTPGLEGGEKQYFRLRLDNRTARYRVYRLASMAWPNKKRAPDEYFEPLVHPDTREQCPVPARGWRYPPTTIASFLAEERIEFGNDHSVQPQQRLYLDEYMEQRLPSVIKDARSDDDFFTEIGLQFENPKPYEFAARILKAFCRPGEIILDSFAGSGTTGHAVLALNQGDKGNRRCILVELRPDICSTVTLPRLSHVLANMAESESGGGRKGRQASPSDFVIAA